jgi:hypothetical protein
MVSDLPRIGRVARSTVPFSGVNWIALASRFQTICCNRSASAPIVSAARTGVTVHDRWL